MTPEVSSASAVLAMNQGLYNGFLAAGLIWGLVSGGLTAKTSILLTQALPAVVALFILLLTQEQGLKTGEKL